MPVPYPGVVIRFNANANGFECLMTNNPRALTFATGENGTQAEMVSAFADAMTQGGSQATFAASTCFVDAGAPEIMNTFLQAGRGLYYGLDLIYTVQRIDLFEDCVAAGEALLAAL